MASVRHLGLFPWCIYPNKETVKKDLFLTEQEYNNNIYIFEGLLQTKAQATSLYWRVKRWKAEGSFLAISPSETIEVPFGYTYQRINEQNVVCTSEKELVCAPKLTRQENLIEFTHPTYTNSFSMASAEFDIGLIQQPAALTGAAGLVEKDKIYNWQYVNFFSDTEELITGLLNSQKNLASIPATYSLSAFGSSQTVACGTNLAGSMTLEISAIEYWPYDPEDGGGPIYDITTGKQLRPFPD
jgi:hypothetical protein